MAETELIEANVGENAMKKTVLGCAVLLGLGLGSLSAPALAAKRLGAGPYWNTKYRTVYEGANRYETWDGRLVVTQDKIETINCGGCDVVDYYPGSVFHVTNVSREPRCFSFPFTLKETSYGRVYSWGSGEVFLVKPRKTIRKFAGISASFGHSGTFNLGWDGSVHSWAPISRNKCGPNPHL